MSNNDRLFRVGNTGDILEFLALNPLKDDIGLSIMALYRFGATDFTYSFLYKGLILVPIKELMEEIASEKRLMYYDNDYNVGISTFHQPCLHFF